MADSTTLSLAALGDPSQYKLLGSVPWFRAHRRKRDDGGETVVNEKDLAEIAEHMQALEREGRLFRLTHGHINPAGEEDEQPELLGFARNARLDFFGPERIPCVMVDEYGRTDKLPVLRERPYRSAEYYGKSKVITGAAALIRDPQLNLGAVLYGADSSPWYYSEAIQMPEPEKEPELSPEKVQEYEAMCKYIAKKWPKVFGPEAMGTADGEEPAPVGDKPDDDPEEKKPQPFRRFETPEFYALKRQADADRAEVGRLRRERETEKCQIIVKDLARHYKLDEAREIRTLLPLSAAEREEHVAYIRANYSELPGGDPIDLYRGNASDAQPGGANAAPSGHETALAYLRAHPGTKYHDALAIVTKK